MELTDFNQFLESVKNNNLLHPNDALFERIQLKLKVEDIQSKTFFSLWNVAAASLIFVLINSFVVFGYIKTNNKNKTSNYELITEYNFYDYE